MCYCLLSNRFTDLFACSFTRTASPVVATTSTIRKTSQRQFRVRNADTDVDSSVQRGVIDRMPLGAPEKCCVCDACVLCSQQSCDHVNEICSACVSRCAN
ncbi:unnamed protein product [Toxocara canis]|uniref:Secreted protein n=1 Tax=Toxocara canis TaxID=6265 RepID=A0A183V159_TOXCA|nr:unnamed protein product [Toxocara canis]